MLSAGYVCYRILKRAGRIFIVVLGPFRPGVDGRSVAGFSSCRQGRWLLRDLFGREVTIEEARRLIKKGRRKEPTPSGYAAPPGTGPEGETCKSCKHIERIALARTYIKCGLFLHPTHGRKTDIKAGSPACKFWEQNPDRPTKEDIA